MDLYLIFKNMKWSLLSLIVFSLLLVVLLFVQSNKQTKIGYVRSDYLIDNYKGVDDFKQIMDFETRSEQGIIDSLKREYDLKLRLLQENEERLTKNIGDAQMKLHHLVYEINYRSEELLKRKDEKRMRLYEGILNQVNECIGRYAKREGYDYILGATSFGNLVYGNDVYDLTEVVLDELNANYKGTN